MKRVAIIGGGQIGSRHLQALALMHEPLTICVVDPSEESRDTCKRRFAEVPSSTRHNLELFDGMKFDNSNFDAAIIASSSIVRRSLVLDFLNSCYCEQVILEKFLFPKQEQYYEVSQAFERRNVKAWVNCCLRSNPFYQKMKDNLLKGSSVVMTVTGGEWGMGSNSVHYIDLFLFLTGSDRLDEVEENFDDSFLNSKRSGYVEVTGSISLGTGKHLLKLESNRSVDRPTSIEIAANGCTWKIVDRIDHIEVEKHCDGVVASAMVGMPFQSQMTNRVLENLLAFGTCDLPSFSFSTQYHKRILAVLEKYVERRGFPREENYFFT